MSDALTRPMRRTRQALDQAACEAILRGGTSGVLAVTTPDGWPYAVPLSYVFDGGTLYFHGASEGLKLDALRHSDRASFCVVAQDQIVPERFTTYFRSAIAFGRVRVLAGEEKRRALELLGERYSPGQPGLGEEIDGALARVCVLALTVERLSGKEAIELVRQTQK